MISRLHNWSIYQHRVNALSLKLATLIRPGQKVLDVGSGDGEVAIRIKKKIDIDVIGIDVVARSTNQIPITMYDGKKIPFDDESFNVVMVCDVLHHTEQPLECLAEIVRVSDSHIVIKDHLCENYWSYLILRFMDWVGNAHIGVSLPYNYYSRSQWEEAFKELNLSVVKWDEDIQLYRQPLQFVFGRRLHFVALLKKE